MEDKGVQVTIKIPIVTNKPNKNGIIFTEESIRNACITGENAPLITYDTEDKENIIGIIKNVEYVDGSLVVDGIAMDYNFEFTVKDYDKQSKTIKKFVFNSFSIGRKID